MKPSVGATEAHTLHVKKVESSTRAARTRPRCLATRHLRLPTLLPQKNPHLISLSYLTCKQIHGTKYEVSCQNYVRTYQVAMLSISLWSRLARTEGLFDCSPASNATPVRWRVASGEYLPLFITKRVCYQVPFTSHLLTFFIKLKTTASCEIEEFVEAYVCTLCVCHTWIARTVYGFI